MDDALAELPASAFSTAVSEGDGGAASKAVDDKLCDEVVEEVEAEPSAGAVESEDKEVAVAVEAEAAAEWDMSDSDSDEEGEEDLRFLPAEKPVDRGITASSLASGRSSLREMRRRSPRAGQRLQLKLSARAMSSKRRAPRWVEDGCPVMPCLTPRERTGAAPWVLTSRVSFKTFPTPPRVPSKKKAAASAAAGGGGKDSSVRTPTFSATFLGCHDSLRLKRVATPGTEEAAAASPRHDSYTDPRDYTRSLRDLTATKMPDGPQTPRFCTVVGRNRWYPGMDTVLAKQEASKLAEEAKRNPTLRKRLRARLGKAKRRAPPGTITRIPKRERLSSQSVRKEGVTSLPVLSPPRRQEFYDYGP